MGVKSCVDVMMELQILETLGTYFMTTEPHSVTPLSYPSLLISVDIFSFSFVKFVHGSHWEI
jgi:hypothetical protein